MKRGDLSCTAKRRLDANPICLKCNCAIEDSDKILFIVTRKRRFKIYVFYHERCLIDGEKKKAK